MFTPGGEREKYFEGLAELLKDGQTPNREALLELMRQFDSYSHWLQANIKTSSYSLRQTTALFVIEIACGWSVILTIYCL